MYQGRAAADPVIGHGCAVPTGVSRMVPAGVSRTERAGKKTDAFGDDVDNQIRAELTEFIVMNYLFGDIASAPRDDDALVEEGIVDSTGILELIEFLESHFEIEVSEAETVPQNLGSISALTEFVTSKLSVREPTF